MAKFFIETARNMVNSAAKRGAFIGPAFELAREQFVPIHDSLLEEFNNHLVTKEIELGSNGTNITQTLQGLGNAKHREKEYAEPNLTSFLGLSDGASEITQIRELFQTQVYIKKVGRGAQYYKNENKIRYEFPIFTPTKGEIENITTLEWGSGKSWIYAIEKFVSGLSEYIYWRRLDKSKSRSETGLQADRTIRQGSIFKPIKYLSEILANFKKRIS